MGDKRQLFREFFSVDVVVTPQLQPEEIKTLTKAFSPAIDPSTFQQNGIRLGGQKYTFLRSEDRSVLGRKVCISFSEQICFLWTALICSSLSFSRCLFAGW